MDRSVKQALLEEGDGGERRGHGPIPYVGV
jgi:hypothetical protein